MKYGSGFERKRGERVDAVGGKERLNEMIERE